MTCFSKTHSGGQVEFLRGKSESKGVSSSRLLQESKQKCWQLRLS